MKQPLTILACISCICLDKADACGYISPEMQAWTQYYARGFGLDTQLLTAVIWTESNYCPQRVSKAGAAGLGQLMPNTAAEMGVQNRFDPAWNIYGTAKYLRKQWDTFQDWNFALAAYNAGPGAVKKHGGVPPYQETQQYIQKVLWTYEWLKKQK